MTQVWPVCGWAPVPTLVSVIWRPDAVVMVFPWVCADTCVAAAAKRTSARRTRPGRALRPRTADILLLAERVGRKVGCCLADIAVERTSQWTDATNLSACARVIAY